MKSLSTWSRLSPKISTPISFEEASNAHSDSLFELNWTKLLIDMDSRFSNFVYIQIQEGTKESASFKIIKVMRSDRLLWFVLKKCSFIFLMHCVELVLVFSMAAAIICWWHTVGWNLPKKMQFKKKSDCLHQRLKSKFF